MLYCLQWASAAMQRTSLDVQSCAGDQDSKLTEEAIKEREQAHTTCRHIDQEI